MKRNLSEKARAVDSKRKARAKCVKKFLYYFRDGFKGDKYISWERDYKWQAHLKWKELLGREKFTEMLRKGQYAEIAKAAAGIESRTNLLFSFEKMALRDAVKTRQGQKDFAEGLFDLVYGKDDFRQRFERFIHTLSILPRKQTRVLTWPLATVFAFIGDPKNHIFLKPRVTRLAADKYGYNFEYSSRPNWDTYKSLLNFAKEVKKDVAFLKPRDMIDLQSFIWVMGSDEYPD